MWHNYRINTKKGGNKQTKQGGTLRENAPVKKGIPSVEK